MTEEAAKGLLLVMIGIDPVHEAELNDWYDVEHFPERMVCPGFLIGRRFTAVEGAPKCLAIYDLENPGVLHSEPYKQIARPTRWTQRIAAHFNPIVRNVYLEVRPPVVSGARLTGEGLLLVAIEAFRDGAPRVTAHDLPAFVARRCRRPFGHAIWRRSRREKASKAPPAQGRRP